MSTLCVCGHDRSEHDATTDLDRLGCEGFQAVTAPYTIETVYAPNNLYRVVGPGFRSHPCSGKLATELATGLNEGRIQP